MPLRLVPCRRRANAAVIRSRSAMIDAAEGPEHAGGLPRRATCTGTMSKRGLRRGRGRFFIVAGSSQQLG